MIHIDPKDEPPEFDTNVRKPGQRLLQELRGDASAPKRPGPKRKPVSEIKSEHLESYWTQCLDNLADAFNQVCAYCCIRIDAITGDRTVDHFVGKVKNPDLAYEWSNYRYSSGTMNSRKERVKGEFCDPFVIQDGWFELNLITMELKPNPTCSGEQAALIQRTINALELDLQPMRDRRSVAYQKFLNDRTLRGWKLMEEDCPLVAREHERLYGKPNLPEQ